MSIEKEMQLRAYAEKTEHKDFFGYCKRCRTVSKNPSAWGLDSIRFECSGCSEFIDLMVEVDKGAAPPQWFLDLISKDAGL